MDEGPTVFIIDNHLSTINNNLSNALEHLTYILGRNWWNNRQEMMDDIMNARMHSTLMFNLCKNMIREYDQNNAMMNYFTTQMPNVINGHAFSFIALLQPAMEIACSDIEGLTFLSREAIHLNHHANHVYRVLQSTYTCFNIASCWLQIVTNFRRARKVMLGLIDCTEYPENAFWGLDDASFYLEENHHEDFDEDESIDEDVLYDDDDEIEDADFTDWSGDSDDAQEVF